jgi:hypothetical protein
VLFSAVKVTEVESLKKAFAVQNANYLMGHVYIRLDRLFALNRGLKGLDGLCCLVLVENGI